ncbi:hypothetical protein BKA83DRAFT_4627261 [Pisolithus microcarpus]|nr:hypothetical protein BKA83DRAFT_4627261 [Pisolithus microcarpus]
MLAMLTLGDPKHIGYDPTLIYFPSIPRQISSRNTSPGTIQVASTMYNIVDQIFFSFLICGWATSCWHVRLNNKHYVVKDSWTCVNQVSCEEDILRKIQDLKGVPQLIAAWTVEIGGSDDRTHLCHESIFPSDDVQIHRRLVMQPVATPLSNFNSIHELLSVFIDVLDMHMTLVMQYFILHRNISDNNLMIYPCNIPKGKTKQHCKVEASSSERCLRDDKGSQDDNRDSHAESHCSDAVDIGKEETHEQKLRQWDQERCQQIQAGILCNGLLIDFDYATKLGQSQPRVLTAGDHTGTILFMSASILISYKKDETMHSASDDLESIIYVLVWMCVLYAGPGTIHQDKHVTQTVLKPWVSVTNPTDAVNLGLHKRGLTTEPSMVTDEFTTFFKPLCSTVDKLLRALGANWSTTDDALNYKTIRDILLEGFGTVEEVPNWSGHKDVYGYGLLRENTEQTATSKVSHASYLEMATANEPLNPLAPAKSKPKPKPCVKTSSACALNDGQLPKSLQEPTSLDRVSPPTYQVAVKGSRYGFCLAGLDKQHEQDNITMAPTSCAGSVAPMSRRGSIAPTSCRGSVVPTSRRGSVLPVSRRSSVVPVSHGGSIAPSSHGGSIPLSSHTTGALPRSQGHSADLPSMTIHACRPYCGYRSEEEDSQLLDHHYSFPNVPVNDDGFCRQGTQHLQTSGGIDLDIDEASSGEDDRVAESLIRNSWQQECQSVKPQTSYKHGAPSSIELLAEDACFEIDVVKEHHHQNCFPHAPDPQHLCDVHQLLPGSALLQQDLPLRECSPAAADIKHLMPVVSSAKQLAQCGATSDPFPSRAWFVDEKTAMYITEAMAEREQMGMLIPPGYWPDYHKDLGVLLWEALMTWRLTLKAKAREYVVQHYLLGSNRPAEENLANAQELIRGAKFVRDGVEDGTTRNMASPALAGLVVDFFYATLSALGNLFPEVFVQEVPKPVICLVATADHQFESSTYSKVFVQLMAMQTKIDGNRKHAAMTRALRDWCIALLSGKTAITSEDDFEVVLD